MAEERPILFSTPLVQAILTGRKLQTRRVVKWKFISSSIHEPSMHLGEYFTGMPSSGYVLRLKEKGLWQNQTEKAFCPYGKVGDLLWVRETVGIGRASGLFYYRANYNNDTINGNAKTNFFDKWTPSIHMPKAAARIWLEITDIKIERLKDISEEDAIAEGVEIIADGFKNYAKVPKIISTLQCFDKAYFSFLSLWESINGYESSELNPWVWVITFKKVAKP